MKDKVYFADAFTDSIGKGNRVGVIYNPKHSIDPEKYCALATELNVSEIAIIMQDKLVDYEFRFFAPKEEVALCGHGTIGSLALLYKLNIEKSSRPHLKIRLKAGVIEGGMSSDKLYYMKQSLPQFYSTVIDVERVANILGIDRQD
ncbi:MAG: PhzF family phenazine biosynthesis isomerase, partial [Desulfobacterales bacterium]|nr:PhzF family phenazine biosynthesis isomerase [Desulfobacterales bacterium]